ncbi:unnamed protein product [Phytophthora fragariaefolia]|uniref:Unnamed protein product n=1 Tax=Phytophthora fragariaefolia TaxID=1490495 RepID=A0A9W6WTP1_9STRA|nr:unnamed protein product [Phytophthora fragariaefolia]
MIRTHARSAGEPDLCAKCNLIKHKDVSPWMALTVSEIHLKAKTPKSLARHNVIVSNLLCNMKTRSMRSVQGIQDVHRVDATNMAHAIGTSINSTTSDTNFAAAIPVMSSALMPPYVADVSHQALVKWKRERQEYEDAVETRCATTGEDNIKALRTDSIVAELDKVVNIMMNDTIIDIDSIFNTKLKMDMRERDVKARVIKYFMTCDELIMQNGLSSTFSTAAGIKEKCKMLKRHFEPAALRDMIDTHHRLVDPSSKTDEIKLYHLVKEKALEQEKCTTS